jgi:hypothetical protein
VWQAMLSEDQASMYRADIMAIFNDGIFGKCPARVWYQKRGLHWLVFLEDSDHFLEPSLTPWTRSSGRP